MAADQQAAQAALVDNLSGPVDSAWSYLDVSNLDGTLPAFVKALQALTHRFGLMSNTIAARAYTTERASAGIPGSFTVMPSPFPGREQVDKSVRWATKGLWSEAPDLEAARTNVSGVMDRLVLDVGRQTFLDAVHADRKAKGWARVPEPAACAFCALLATRGAVYRTERSASFLSHDHCRCHVQAVFNSYEPSAQIRQWQSVYDEAKRTASGPKATRLAFRLALDASRAA